VRYFKLEINNTGSNYPLLYTGFTL